MNLNNACQLMLLKCQNEIKKIVHKKTKTTTECLSIPSIKTYLKLKHIHKCSRVYLMARTQWNIKMTYIGYRSHCTKDLNIQTFMKQMDQKKQTCNGTLSIGLYILIYLHKWYVWDFAANTFCLQTTHVTRGELEGMKCFCAERKL